jgi:hypothetical protein
MDRRQLLLALGALAGCAPADDGLVVVCDPDLGPPLQIALMAWVRKGEVPGYSLEVADAKRLLARGETMPGRVIITREPKLADRLQRYGYARLQNRFKPRIGAGQVQVVVTRGAGEGGGVRFARWLTTDEAAALLTAP